MLREGASFAPPRVNRNRVIVREKLMSALVNAT